MDKGNTTYYDEAIRQVWVLGYAFTRNVSSDGRFKGDSKLTPGNVTCIHAGSIAHGSRTFEEGAGVVLHARGATVAAVVVVVVVMLFL